jgi:hypothetical protein
MIEQIILIFFAKMLVMGIFILIAKPILSMIELIVSVIRERT